MSTISIRKENQIQRPDYYVSGRLKKADLKYYGLEKLAYAIVIVVRKFQMHLLDSQRIFWLGTPPK